MFKSVLTSTARRVTIRQARFSSQQPTVLYTWGNGTEGQLGHAKFELSTNIMGRNYTQDEPRKMLRSKKFEKVAIGPVHTFAVSNTNDLYAWGTGFLDEKSHSKEPVAIAPGLKVKSVAAGPKHNAVIGLDGQVYTWGHGGSWMSGGGQLGHGNTGREDQPRLIESFKLYGAKAAQVALGEHHTVILTDDGEVLSCGVGEYGRQGTGSTSDALVPTTVEALEDDEIVQVAAGFDHTLVLNSKGAIYSWGRNQSGQLGHSDSYIDIYSMEDFPRLIDAESINNGENAEALAADGEIPTNAPIFSQVACGSGRSAAVTTDGHLYIWGARVSHQPKLIAKSLFNGHRVVKVACGGELGKSAFAVITEDDSLWMIGDASSKLLGSAGLSGRYPVPRLVPSLVNKVVDVSCGFGQHMAAFVKVTDTD